MIFITLYKLKKKEDEKCSYIVFKKRCLVIRISRILYLTAFGFFIFFFFLHSEVLLLALGADARVL